MLTLLLLADSRLPSGGHGHSGGVEALVDRELVRSADDLALFLDGRVRTGGRVLAAAAAAGCALARQCAAAAAADVPADQAPDSPRGDRRRSEGASEPPHVAIRCAVAEAASTDWARWDAAVSARTPSAALRVASRAQGAALLRTVTRRAGREAGRRPR